jgi:pyruvate dehydrogenase E1 component beta subunit
MPKINMVDALNLALKQEMAKDRSVVVLGEDVGKDGGVFRVTDGLLKKFGPNRVIDTPLAETGIIGSAIGMALYGLKPVAEAQFDGFSLPMLDQLINHASRFRSRSRGRWTVPLVLRFPYSGGVRAFEHHSESPETHYIHTPGLKVVVPSSPYEAKGLLVSAIRDPNPVVFMEPKRVYRAIKEDVPEKEYAIPLGKARIAREGTDVTVIAWGAMVKTCLEAAEEAANRNIDCEVIDLRTLSPLDTETVINSVNKTGRVVIAHEAPRTLGFGAELSALVMEKAMLRLQAPVERVTGFDTVIPFGKLEELYIPDKWRILRSIEKVKAF